MTNPIPWQRLRELAERATPGPWAHLEKGSVPASVEALLEHVSLTVADCIDDGSDAEFIAALDPATVLQMVAEHAAVREALERARGCIYGLAAQTPVRDIAETLAEIDAALTGGEK